VFYAFYQMWIRPMTYIDLLLGVAATCSVLILVSFTIFIWMILYQAWKDR
jgi:hypothetical protein